jgi:hypothetical protein
MSGPAGPAPGVLLAALATACRGLTARQAREATQNMSFDPSTHTRTRRSGPVRAQVLRGGKQVGEREGGQPPALDLEPVCDEEGDTCVLPAVDVSWEQGRG